MRYTIRGNFTKRMNVNTCADPMKYTEDVHTQAIDVWTNSNDYTDCGVIAADSGVDFDSSAERFEATSAWIRCSPRPGGL